MMRIAFVIILVAAAFFIGVNIGSSYRVPVFQEIADEANIAFITTKVGFSEINVSIEGTTISLIGKCRLIQFDVTQDQAYSIATAMTNTSPQRPLAHDLLKDILDNFGVKILRIDLDRYEDSIYKATIYLQKGNDVLSIDARPSDSMALSLRYDMPLYIKDSILEEQGRYIC